MSRTPLLTEGAVRTKIRAHIYDLFPGAYVESNPPSAWGESGRPDIELCYEGAYIGLELKAGRYKDAPWKGLTDEQDNKLKAIQRAGGVTLITNRVPVLTSAGWMLAVWKRNYYDLWVYTELRSPIVDQRPT